MRAVIQRVAEARVVVEEEVIASIGKGLVVFMGVEAADTEEDGDWLASKIAALRIFNDEIGKMNLDINQVDGDLITVSQFTLHAKTKKGTRPSFIRAAAPEHADKLYNYTATALSKIIGKSKKTGQFGADMKVVLINDGPVTILIDTKNKE